MLSFERKDNNKVEIFREVQLALDVLDGAIYSSLRKLGYRIDSLADLDMDNDLREFLINHGHLQETKTVIREATTLGTVTYHWYDSELGLRSAALGGITLTKKNAETTRCNLFSPPRFEFESKEEYSKRHNMSFRRSAELVKDLQSIGSWPIAESTTWKKTQEFIFDANAFEVCQFILGNEELRTIKLTSGNWAFEGYISATPTIGALFSILVIVNISDGKELGWLRDDAIWLVHDKEVAEIGLTQEKPGECIAQLFVETNLKKWNREGKQSALHIGQQFIGQLWKEIINDWLSRSAEQVRARPSKEHPISDDEARKSNLEDKKTQTEMLADPLYYERNIEPATIKEIFRYIIELNNERSGISRAIEQPEGVIRWIEFNPKQREDNHLVFFAYENSEKKEVNPVREALGEVIEFKCFGIGKKIKIKATCWDSENPLIAEYFEKIWGELEEFLSSQKEPFITVEKPSQPAKPERGSNIDVWFDWYHAMNAAGYKMTFPRLAEESGYSKNTFKAEHKRYKISRGIDIPNT